MKLRSAIAFLCFFGTTSIANAQISDDVVKIGVLTDMTGVYSDSVGPGAVTAARMAAADFGGTVLGKPIDIIFADHQNKPDVGSTLAREWLDRQHVDAIVDVVNSSVALAVQTIVRERNKVLLISGGGTSELTGKSCSPNGIQWTYDTYALAHATAKGMLERGGDTWFFISADYTLGKELEQEATVEILRGHGKVLGSVKAPLGTTDFSSYLLQAQASGAKVVALANAGTDAVNAVKQAAEFGLTAHGQRLVGMLVTATEAHNMTLAIAGGMIETEAFFADRDDATRAFSKRFMAVHGAPPTQGQAGVYSSVTNYLQAIAAVGTDAPGPVLAQLKTARVKDFFAPDGYVRADGRMVHDMYLLQVKTPAESSGDWDLYKLLATIPGDQAFRPLAEGGCPLLKP
jgi:branched-chain amino acid transport system substrate-binding protein